MFFSLGTLSPVIELSLINVVPLKIIPSVGTWSPFKTCSLSPISTLSIGIIFVLLSSKTNLACVGFRFNRFVISFLLFSSTYSSKKCAPAKITISIAASS